MILGALSRNFFGEPLSAHGRSRKSGQNEIAHFAMRNETFRMAGVSHWNPYGWRITHFAVLFVFNDLTPFLFRRFRRRHRPALAYILVNARAQSRYLATVAGISQNCNLFFIFFRNQVSATLSRRPGTNGVAALKDEKRWATRDSRLRRHERCKHGRRAPATSETWLAGTSPATTEASSPSGFDLVFLVRPPAQGPIARFRTSASAVATMRS